MSNKQTDKKTTTTTTTGKKSIHKKNMEQIDNVLWFMKSKRVTERIPNGRQPRNSVEFEYTVIMDRFRW